MRVLLIKIFAIVLFPFNKQKRKNFRKKYLQNIKAFSCNFVKNKSFYTYDNKPMYSNEYRALSDNFAGRADMAIMLQGPIKQEWNFTLETIKIYRKNFAGCKIIVSTWDNEDEKICRQLKELGVTLVLSKMPASNYLNMHNQIISSRAGLEKAKDMGCKFALKTRTDQRLYETNIPEYLLNVLNTFPLSESVKTQKQRLITTSFNTFKYRLYEISDMFLFGDIDDVLNFWSCPLPDIKPNNPKGLIQFLKNLPSEIYYTTNFLERTGWNIKWTLADSWKAFAERFAVVDTVSVGLYWPKYSTEVNRFRNFFGKLNVLEELTFKEWLDLYVHDGRKLFIPEYYIQNANISSDDLVLQNNKIFIKLSAEHQKLLSYFNMSDYCAEPKLSANLAFVLTDSENMSKEQVVRMANQYPELAVVYITQSKMEKLNTDNIIVLEDDEFLLNTLANLRFFPMAK